jgi:predicted polyphosphate/ATP-dependent NAD kinase
MALGKFGFVVVGSGLSPAEHRVHMRSPAFEMIAVGISSPDHGPEAARALVAEGVQLIELCGGFGAIWTARVLEAIGHAVPVGAVSYGPEAIAPLARLFET